MDTLVGALEVLRQQVELALENAAQGARESHESWSKRVDAAEAAGQQLSPESFEEVQEERRYEMLCLGQAAGLAWVGMRLATILKTFGSVQPEHGWDAQTWSERESLTDR